ncbi:MAG: YihY/virulence factor BrkB family protein [Thermodesulfobacteriota bacterium]
MTSMNWKRWIAGELHFLFDVLRKFDGDHGLFLSAGITFNLLICVVPFILLLLALIGTYLYSSHEILSHLRHYLENIAPSLDPRIMGNVLKIVRDRKIVGILGIGGLIWTSTWMFSSLRTSLNIVFQVERGRSILRGKAIDLLMILLAGIFLLVSMVLTSAVTFLQSYRFQSIIDIGPILQWILKYLVPFFFTFWMCFLIYKIIPNKKIQFRTALQAAFFTSLLWEVAKQLFGWYVMHLGRFSMVYGSLSTLTIFFLWIYYSSAILILGGEVAFLLEKKGFDQRRSFRRGRK